MSRVSPVESRIIAGLEDAVAYAKGDKRRGRAVHVPRRIDVAEIRRKTSLSQARFAAQFGLSLATLRNWEQGHREPPAVARVLLTLIDRMPDRVQEALHSAG
jgi:putative transcriptional regulator